MQNKLNILWENRNNIHLRPLNSWIDNKWAIGRNKHIVFLVKLEDNEIKNNIIKLYKNITNIPSLKLFPLDYLHITIKPIGFLNNKKYNYDDYTHKEIFKIANNVKELLCSFGGFDIILLNINIFPDTLFVEIEDKGKFAEINRKILSIQKIKRLPERDYPNFIPHMSVANFKDKRDKNIIIREVEKVRNFNIGKLHIDKVHLALVHLNKIFPKIEVIDTINLEKG